MSILSKYKTTILKLVSYALAFLLGATTSLIFMMKMMADFHQAELLKEIKTSSIHLRLKKENDYVETIESLEDKLRVQLKVLRGRMKNDWFYSCENETLKVLTHAAAHVTVEEIEKCSSLAFSLRNEIHQKHTL